MGWLPNVFGNGNSNQNQQRQQAPTAQGNPQGQGPQQNQNAQNPNAPASIQGNPGTAGGSFGNNPNANPQNFSQNSNGNGNQNPAVPMDQFTHFFNKQGGQNPQAQPNQQGNQNPQNPQNQQQPPAYDGYLFEMNLQQLQQVAGQQDFTRNINPEILQKALSGDGQAMIQIINQTAQQAFAASAATAHGFVEKGVGNGYEKMSKGLDSRFRDFQVRSQNPVHESMNHPAVKPIFEAMKKQIAGADPSLSADKVASMASDYVMHLGQHVTPSSNSGQNGGNPQAGNQSKETNWMESFGLSDPQSQTYQ